MARKKKTDTPPVEEMLEKPATTPTEETPEIPAAPPASAEGTEVVIPAPDPASREWRWPVSTERRRLPVPITAEKRAQLGAELSRLVDRIDSVDAERKAAASSYKARLDELHGDLTAANDEFKAGTVEELIECQWTFEKALRNGEIVDDPNHKILQRLDNMAVVLCTAITDEDRQGSLDLPGVEPEMTIEEMTAFITAEGFEIVNNDPPGPEKPPFELVDMAFPENRRALEAATTDEALQAAVAMLKAIPDDDDDGDPGGDDDTGDDDSGDDTGESNIIPFDPMAGGQSVEQTGYDARMSGVRRDQCPHADGTEEADKWKQGWDEANDEAHAAHNSPVAE